MDKLFPFKKRFFQKHPNGVERKADTLNWTIKVVCEKCNNTWMSEIEQQHAMPVMTPLILGVTGTVIPQLQADSISLFAFKTAVVLSCIDRKRQSFFPRYVRHGFRTNRGIPLNTRMWLAGYGLFEQGNVKTVYHEGKLSTGHGVQLYTCTFSAGHLVFQTMSLKYFFGPQVAIRPRDDRFEFLAVPFWPSIPSGVVWPLSHVLGNQSDFEAFAERWRSVLVQRASG
jgi:hypothetical protein